MIFGAFAILALGSRVALVALLVLLKIGLDMALHLLERESGAIALPSPSGFRGND